jgi:hypothetical protein
MVLFSTVAVFFQIFISDVRAETTSVRPLFPGGYLGISASFGKNRTTGLQGSVGIAVPSVGEPARGPYLFPGIAVGKRRSSADQKEYVYTDLQITYLHSGIWGGAGVGRLFSEEGNRLRSKIYGGYLMGGYSTEYLMGADMENLFHGIHLGVAVPMIGSHLYP